MVDDEPAVAGVLSRALSQVGYIVTTAFTGEEALDHVQGRTFDAIITDLHMPRMQGDELLRRCKCLDSSIVVLVLTAAGDIDCAVRCLQEGAVDYVSKPFDLHDVVARLDKALDQRHMFLNQQRLTSENLNYQLNLQKLVDEQAKQLRAMFQNSLQTLNYALEAKDESTRNHSHRVAMVASAIATQLPEFRKEDRDRLQMAAEFHDIGKIGVPESILTKSGELTEAEFELIKKHPEIGENILRPLFNDIHLLEIVRGHHEQWNGSGYPDGLMEHQIPLGARIVAVSDAYDAMTSARAYRRGMEPKQALEILSEGAWIQWDGDIVAVILSLAESGELFSLTASARSWTPGLYQVEGKSQRQEPLATLPQLDEAA